MSIGFGGALGPFRMGISPDLLDWMKRTGIPTDPKLYKENLFIKRWTYYFFVFINSPRPWLVQHMPECVRRVMRKVLRK
jgi:hypothetical protein